MAQHISIIIVKRVRDLTENARQNSIRGAIQGKTTKIIERNGRMRVLINMPHKIRAQVNKSQTFPRK